MTKLAKLFSSLTTRQLRMVDKYGSLQAGHLVYRDRLSMKAVRKRRTRNRMARRSRRINRGTR